MSNHHHRIITSDIKIYIHIHYIVFIYNCNKKITLSKASVSRVNWLNMSKYCIQKQVQQSFTDYRGFSHEEDNKGS
jgi:hypothetical protein